MSMVDTGLVRFPGVHPLNCLGNRSLGILVILGVLMGNLRFVDNPVTKKKTALKI